MRWDTLLVIAVLALAAATVLGRRVVPNSGQVSDSVRARPTSIMSSAAVLAAVQQQLSARAGCRVEFTSVKTLQANRTEAGTAYRLDAMVMNTCTLAQTLEQLQVVLDNEGRVSVVGSVPVTPVPAVKQTAGPSALETALDVVAADGAVDAAGGEKIGAGYTFAALQEAGGGAVAAFPHEAVTSPQLFGNAPPEIPESLDFGIFSQVKPEPATDLTNSLAYEESALSIMYR